MFSKSRRSSARALLCAASAFALTSQAAPAVAQSSQRQQVAIEAQSLREALLEVGRRFGVSISAAPSLVSGKRAPRVRGTLNAEQTIARLLAGSGLSYKRSGGGYVISQDVQPAQNQSRTRAGGSQRPISNQGSETSEQSDPIVVTGRFQDSLIDRLPITIEELPFTLSTVTREEIDERGFIRPIDILSTKPNVQLRGDGSSIGQTRFFVRGFEAPQLINNVDVTRFARDRTALDDVFVERYEVLKGPASIALGPVAGGGIINTITKEPRAQDFSALRLSADQFGSYIVEGDFNEGQLLGSDDVSARVNVAYRDISFDAEEISRQEFAIRGVVAADLSDKTSARASVAYREIEAPPNNFFPPFNDGSIPEEFDTDTFFAFTGANQLVDMFFADMQVTHDFLDNLQLTLRGSYQENSFVQNQRNGSYNYRTNGISRDDPAVFGYSFFGENDDQTIFVDAQLLYTFDFNELEQSIVLGASYTENETEGRGSFAGIVGPFALDELNVPRFGFPDFVLTGPPTFRNEADLPSVYAEFAFRPVEGLTIVGGLRFDELTTQQLNQDTLRTRDLNIRLGASYAITDNFNIFASYAESFLPQTGIRRDGNVVGPETAQNYEIGAKASFFEGLIDASVSAFSISRQNVAVRDPTALPGEVFFIAIGEQRNRGVEVSVNLDTDVGFNLEANYGYLSQEIISSLDDAVLPPVPENNISILASYTVQEGPVAGFKVGGGLRYFGSLPSRAGGVFFDGATVGDVFVSYPLTQDASIQLNVINVTDNLYLEQAGLTGILTGRAAFGAPRTFIASLRTRF